MRQEEEEATTATQETTASSQQQKPNSTRNSPPNMTKQPPAAQSKAIATTPVNLISNQQQLVERLIDSDLEWRQLICELNGISNLDELLERDNKSAAPSPFTECQLKRQEVIHELIITERHHCLTLALMRQVYVTSLRKLNEARLKSPTGTHSLPGHQISSTSKLINNNNINNHDPATTPPSNTPNSSRSNSVVDQSAHLLLMGGDLIDLERLFPALDDLIQAHELLFAHLRLLLVESCRNKPLGFVGPLGRLLANQFRLNKPASQANNGQQQQQHQLMQLNTSHLQNHCDQAKPDSAAATTMANNTSNGHKLLAAYTKFCGQQSNSNRYYKHLMQNDRGFKSLIESIEQQQQQQQQQSPSSGSTCAGNHPASSLLISRTRRGIPECNLLVAQRLTKYPLLIEQLIKTSKDEEPAEVEALQESLGECRNLLTELNSQLARKESFERLLDIYANFSLKSHTIYNHRTKFTKHNLLQHKRLRQLLHLDDQLRLWSATRRKLFQIVCLVLNDLVVFLRTEQHAGGGALPHQAAVAATANNPSIGSGAAREQHLTASLSSINQQANQQQQQQALASHSGCHQDCCNSFLYDQYGSLAPSSIASQSNGLVYYFANIDNKSSVISLSKLLVREKAQISDSGEPRLYLISSSVRQPEMYELAFTSKRHQTTFVQKLKAAIEMRRSDLNERRAASQLCRQQMSSGVACPGNNPNIGGSRCAGPGSCKADCSMGWTTTTSSCTSDEDYYYDNEPAGNHQHQDDQASDQCRLDSSRRRRRLESDDDADADADGDGLIDSEDYDNYLEDNDNFDHEINVNDDLIDNDEDGKQGDEDDAIYTTGDNEEDHRKAQKEEALNGGDYDEDEEMSDGFEYDELEPVGDHLRNLDIADGHLNSSSNNSWNAISKEGKDDCRRHANKNEHDFEFDIEHNILSDNNDYDATNIYCKQDDSSFSNQDNSRNATLMSNESGLSERARDSMDESAASGRPRVRANQRRRRLQRLRNVSNQSSSSSEPSQHRQAISQLLNLANVANSSANKEQHSSCTKSNDKSLIEIMSSPDTNCIKALVQQDENEDSGRGLDLDSSASSSAGSTSNTLASCSMTTSPKLSDHHHHEHHHSFGSSMMPVKGDKTGGGTYDLCATADTSNIHETSTQVDPSKSKTTPASPSTTSKSKVSSSSSSLTTSKSLSSQTKLSKSHCSLLIRKPTGALGNGLIGSFKNKQDKQGNNENVSLAKERKLSTVSSLSSQVKLFNRLRSSNYSVSSQHQKSTSSANEQQTSLLCNHCKTRCNQENYNQGLVRHPNRRTALFVPEQKLEELRDLQIQLNKDKQEWQTKYERMQEDLLNERRKLDLAYERLKLDQQQVANEREQFYRKLDVLKENGILLTPSHKVHIMNQAHNSNNPQAQHQFQQQLQHQSQMCNNYATTVHFNSDTNRQQLQLKQHQQQQVIWHHQQQLQNNNHPPPYFQHNTHNQSTSININAPNLQGKMDTMQQQQRLQHHVNYNQQHNSPIWHPKQQSLILQNSNQSQVLTPGPKVPIHLANEHAINKNNQQMNAQQNNNPNMSPRGPSCAIIGRSGSSKSNECKNTGNNSTTVNSQQLSSKVSTCLGLSTRIPLLSALGVSFLSDRQPNSN